VKFQGVVVVLAVSGSFSGTLACGRTGVGIFDEVGADGGGHDGDVSAGDTGVVDGASGAPSCPKASDTPAPPSCAPGGAGMTNCGPGGSGSESCCTSLEVEGGTYARAYANDGGGPTGETDPASVTSFRLDKYLVTVGRFRQFVRAWNEGYMPAAGSGKHTHLNEGQGLTDSATELPDGGMVTYETGWDATDWNKTTDIDPTNANLACGLSIDTWTNTAGSEESLPINCVNWYEAYAFCIWDGGFLPSEAEWGYAAAGGNLQREYPWGSSAPGTANQYAIYGRNYVANPTGIAPVGTAALGAGLWGQLDIVGNIAEWTLDWYATYVNPSTDGAYLTPLSERVLRGGNFSLPASYLLPPLRLTASPSYRNYGLGFRCARTP
jgi:formylglycine-generating enzyme required for sulfatase activity